MAFIHQTGTALVGAALKRLNNGFAIHDIDFRCQTRRAGIAHPHFLCCSGDRTEFRDIDHQFSFAASKADTARCNNFETEFEGLTHIIMNNMQYGAEQ